MLTLRAIGPVNTAEQGAAAFGGVVVQGDLAYGLLILRTGSGGVPRGPVVEAIIGDTKTSCEVVGVAGGMDADGFAQVVISWRAMAGADTYQCSVPV